MAVWPDGQAAVCRETEFAFHHAVNEKIFAACYFTLILIPWLMHAAARDEVGSAPETAGVLAVAVLEEVAEFAGVAELPEIPSGFKSSFFHTGHLDIENWIFEAAYRRAGWSCDSEE